MLSVYKSCKHLLLSVIGGKPFFVLLLLILKQKMVLIRQWKKCQKYKEDLDLKKFNKSIKMTENVVYMKEGKIEKDIQFTEEGSCDRRGENLKFEKSMKILPEGSSHEKTPKLILK
jgi:hypothetical protein